MVKPNSIRDTKQLCEDAHDLIDQSARLISGSGAACAAHKDQIEKAREAVTKSRKQISRLRLKGR